MITESLSQDRQCKILGCSMQAFTMEQTINWVDNAIINNQSMQHGCVDAGKLALMYCDAFLYDSVVSSDLINGEGQLLVWLSRLTQQPLPERVVGLDLFENLLILARKKNYKVYLLGATEEVITQLVEHVTVNYSADIIAGYRNGYFSFEEEKNIAKDIANSGAHMLFVGISSPIKENFLRNNAEILSPVNFRMGVGGSFDVVTGKVKRAPKWMQRICLEWFYRFLQEPRDKWKVEVVDSFHFLYLLLKDCIFPKSR